MTLNGLGSYKWNTITLIWVPPAYGILEDVTSLLKVRKTKETKEVIE